MGVIPCDRAGCTEIMVNQYLFVNVETFMNSECHRGTSATPEALEMFATMLQIQER